MRRTIRYGLVGIAALALLSSVSWIRGLHLHLEPTGKYLLGVAPNFAAAIAISFVLLSIWADQKRDANSLSARCWFFICNFTSGSGLICWEFFQKLSKKLVFDTQDVMATLAGMGAATLIFYMVTPRK